MDARQWKRGDRVAELHARHPCGAPGLTQAFPGAVRGVRSGRAQTRGAEQSEARRCEAKQGAGRHADRRTGAALPTHAAHAAPRNVVPRPHAARRNEALVLPCAVRPCAVRPCVAARPCAAVLPCAAVQPCVEQPCGEPPLRARRLDVPAAPGLARRNQLPPTTTLMSGCDAHCATWPKNSALRRATNASRDGIVPARAGRAQVSCKSFASLVQVRNPCPPAMSWPLDRIAPRVGIDRKSRHYKQ